MGRGYNSKLLACDVCIAVALLPPAPQTRSRHCACALHAQRPPSACQSPFSLAFWGHLRNLRGQSCKVATPSWSADGDSFLRPALISIGSGIPDCILLQTIDLTRRLGRAGHEVEFTYGACSQTREMQLGRVARETPLSTSSLSGHW